MRVRDAKAAAHQWVLAEGSQMPGFWGAFLSGSITTMPEDAAFPTSSDVDVKVVVDLPTFPADAEKIRFQDVLLDVSYDASAAYRSPEAVLGTYYTAVHFIRPCIVLDPTGQLRAIQPLVAREYARRQWVRARCEHARSQLEAFLVRDPSAPLHEQVIAWLLAVIGMTHSLLVADLRNPTIRKCLVVVRDVLIRHDELPLYERMLGILGSAAMDRRQVEPLLAACTAAFDAATAIRTTPIPFGTNISEPARPINIAGSHELIAAGFPREAAFWIAAVHTWCQWVFWNDAPADVRDRFTPAYERLLDALGVSSPEAVGERTVQIRNLMPELWQVTEKILATNPAIQN
jgi:hypothetical protein